MTGDVDGRIVRLDSLDRVTREVVLTIIRARKNAEDAAKAVSTGSNAETAEEVADDRGEPQQPA